jgi:hypothetical protein
MVQHETIDRFRRIFPKLQSVKLDVLSLREIIRTCYEDALWELLLRLRTSDAHVFSCPRSPPHDNTAR